MRIAGRDGVESLHDFPLEIGFDHGTLIELAGAPFEAALAPWRAQHFEMRAAVGSGGSRRDQRGVLVDRAVAIDAIEFDRGARLGVEVSAAVIILLEMAIGALHAFFEVDVFQVDGLIEFLRVVGRDDLVVRVEQVAFAIAFEDGAENPSVAVKIGELRRFELLVEFGTANYLRKELRIGPHASHGGRLRISERDLIALFLGRIFLFVRDT